ncbi:MAG: CRISPR-associated endonuclease Cas2 [Candidatus Doudnabacteria bacterium RIFCSPLOWO2_01_FULL_44_21]|uniref:CRISPR-associated endonuclease Cas2 n=1 Tax=Candidatus Doudnabacteria bacterium RIFCSPLOWO2_01_FULL_44_21 TaxID=1817841 RepID=A0A1F5PXP6_9BACT|nr:MAG: CRISPR-associated endonuclease Cas2 [Candidatus Doudnabacteria bacterium RIFCSPHIGHO2_02_FULL_43_13b]OGE94683.1 MAG: CRISPR-associated endonuclease Cas2 [Candidatus Doudnabacteria bacterium RIFCSPLOWO2_01_FULL_44_21]
MNKEELKEAFIETIKDMGGLIDDIIFRPYSLRISRMYYPRSTYYHRLNKFEMQGLVKRKQHRKYGNPFVVTQKGRTLLHKPSIQKRRSDGFSSIIIFDIPEDKHRERNIFRRYLKRNGYTLIQKSVLISPLEISRELEELMEELKIRPYVTKISGKINFS